MSNHSAWNRTACREDKVVRTDIDEKDQLASRSHRRTAVRQNRLNTGADARARKRSRKADAGDSVFATRLASRPKTRSDLLFTMSDITRRMFCTKSRTIRTRKETFLDELNPLVEPDGIEPTTSCLQSRRSPN
jgi:hypothetical protein